MAVLVAQPPAIVREVSAREETVRFLDTFTRAPIKSWENVIHDISNKFANFMVDASPKKTLDQLSAKILQSDDLDLIHLLHRALRNYDSICPNIEKAEPVASHYVHYKKPHFLIPDIHLTIDVQEDKVFVTSELKVKRNSKDASLVLDGKGHKVHEVYVNGELLPKESYNATAHELIIHNIPEKDRFIVRVKSEINAFENKSKEGLYPAQFSNGKKVLTSQCESEGARRIFFTLDRPDVMSRVTTTIIADPKQYPCRLSNGDVIKEGTLEDGRSIITWQDPIPKSSYLFACVLGNFSKVKGNFLSKNGKKIELEVYVEPGKEDRSKYSLRALKKAMRYFENEFDNVYRYKTMKMVGIPDFNSGAMENKTLMIFNDIRLLADSLSATDAAHRDVVHVVGHEYAHDKSGNETTVLSWFEIALKEAFTDLRAILFDSWMFGDEFVRPKQVQQLRESQFPLESPDKSHPIVVESYVDAHSIYDSTTYVKGREVFGALRACMEMWMPGSFKAAQKLYFERYKEKAVTFRQLLEVFNEILKPTGKDLSQFERWFHQQGTPEVQVKMDYDAEKKEVKLHVSQSCINPKTKKNQEPLLIPFSYELLGKDGKVLHPRVNMILSESSLKEPITISVSARPVPVFMHGYSAPVILKYDYSKEDLACIANNSDDAYCRWEAGRNYSLAAMKETIGRLDADKTLKLKAEGGELILKDLLQFYVEALQSKTLSPLSKAQLLQVPTIRALAQEFNCYDFEKLKEIRSLFAKQLAIISKPILEQLLKDHPEPKVYKPSSRQMQIRELRNACFHLLAHADDRYKEVAFNNFKTATNFNNYVSAFATLINVPNPFKIDAVQAFYKKWSGDKTVINYWLASQASSSTCTVEDLRMLESVKGYDITNPNHLRSVLRAFIANLARYHDANGDGYDYVVNRILEIGKENPLLAHNYIATEAFIDFEKLPEKQKALMAKAMDKLLHPPVDKPPAPPQTIDLIKNMLAKYEPNREIYFNK